MLQPNFNIEISQNCKSLIFRDLTGFQSSGSQGGFGGSNINIEQVTKTVLRIKSPIGVIYEIFSTYLPVQGHWELKSSDISDANIQANSVIQQSADCGCSSSNHLAPKNQLYWQGYQSGQSVFDSRDCSKPNRLKVFPDGCTQITYELYAKTGIPVMACQNRMSAVVCDGQKVFAKRNGGWYDITSSGIINNKNFDFVTLQTTDIYDRWEVRDESGAVSEGVFTSYNCTTSGLTSSSPVDKMIASVTKDFVFTCNIERMLADIAFDLIVNQNCVTDNGMSSEENLRFFSLSFSKIEASKNGGYNSLCGCDCVNDNITSAFNNLKAIVDINKYIQCH